jgi:hypothetical protein
MKGWGRPLVVLLVAVLVALLFEAAVHSVHHAGDEAAASCELANASGHFALIAPPAGVPEAPVVAVSGGATAEPHAPVTRRQPSPFAGRAPPFGPSA